MNTEFHMNPEIVNEAETSRILQGVLQGFGVNLMIRDVGFFHKIVSRPYVSGEFYLHNIDE